MAAVTVIKRDLQGQETWRYTGQVLERGDHHILLEAFFNRPDSEFYGILLKQGDRFVETFFDDRWYNIFEMHDRDDGQRKGWYCNVGYPAEFRDGEISYIDLALDLLVFPDGRQLVLDEDEFAALDLSPQDRERARQALTELELKFAQP